MRTIMYLAGRKQKLERKWEQAIREIEDYHRDLLKMVSERCVQYRCRNCGKLVTMSFEEMIRDDECFDLVGVESCWDCVHGGDIQ